MRRARARIGGEVVTGEYKDGTVRHGGTDHPVGGDTDLLAPCDPSALYCVGRNYVATIDQQGYDRPDEPDFFVKPPVSVMPPGETLPYPSFTGELVGAGELAAVVGRECSDLAVGDVPDAVEGYTIMNDLDAYDQPGRTARKAFDGSAPLGPCLATDIDPTDLDMETRVNGAVDHEANTGDMLFDPLDVVAFLSGRFTLRPGDVVAFGSPTNVALDPGDEVTVDYEGIGTLSTTIGPPE